MIQQPSRQCLFVSNRFTSRIRACYSYNKDSTAETLKDVFKEIDGWKAQHPEDRDVVMYGTASALWLLDCLQVDRADDTVGAQLMEKHMNKLWWNMFKNVCALFNVYPYLKTVCPC